MSVARSPDATQHDGYVRKSVGQPPAAKPEMKEGFEKREGSESQARLAGAVPTSLFLVERQLLGITEHQLAILETVITEVTRRFADRGEAVRLVRSTFLPRQERLLTLFAAGSSEVVQAVNDAALVPFTSIEPARELPNQRGT